MKPADTSFSSERVAFRPQVVVSPPASSGILRHSSSDALLVGLALVHGALLLVVPSVPLIALGLWWNANTVSHNFIHLPFFRAGEMNRIFSAYLSLLLGFPQSFWRARHLAHHRGAPFRWASLQRVWLAEGALVLALWGILLALAPKFFLTVYVPGWLIGLGLCQLQGHFEHTRGVVSHHGRLYNWLFFNDGYHVEHHARPARHWTKLPRESAPEAAHLSRWPAVLRWFEHASLDGLEELVCRWDVLQRFVLRVHERAWKKILAGMSLPRRIVIIGGGLFPRTALILRRLAPEATLVIVDLREDRIECARTWLDERVEFVRGFCTPENLVSLTGHADLIVVPLALQGDKAGFYQSTATRSVAVHDWIWRRRGRSAVVSWALFKRLNLVTSASERAGVRGEDTNDRFLQKTDVRPRALALFAALVIAKLLAVAGRHLPESAWTPLALFWQDALVALLFGAVDYCLRKVPAAGRCLFWIIVGYAAVNVALTRILSSPLTWQMSRATGGALADSIRHYLTAGNLTLMAVVMLAAGGFLVISRWLRPRWTACGLAALAALAVTGAFAAARVDCAGQHRNALVAFVESTLPRVRADMPPMATDWRSVTAEDENVAATVRSRDSVFESQHRFSLLESSARDLTVAATAHSAGRTRVEDLTHLRGSAAGRNVVLIALESTGSRYLQCYGAKEDPMPNLTRLAETSLLFENAYAVYPESIKGLFSVLCSRYPAFDTQAEDYAPVRTPSIAQVLANSGYRTAMFHSGRFDYLGMNEVVQRRGFEMLADAGHISGNFNSSFGVDEPATVDRMLAWIDSQPRERPFFLHYLPIAGHHPYATPAPGPFPERDELGSYLNALHFGDAALGKFLDGLRQRGLGTNTLFVIYGDHGEAFGQHEGNYGHTLFIHEENVHVPLLVAMPGASWVHPDVDGGGQGRSADGPPSAAGAWAAGERWDLLRPMAGDALRTRSVRALQTTSGSVPGREAIRVKRTASLLDVAPTLLELLGLEAPRDYQGESLLDPAERAALFFTDYSLPLAGARDGRWKIVLELGSARARLFDLVGDPEERTNLAARYPQRVAEWSRRLHEWSAAQKALVLRPELLARRRDAP